MPDILHARSMGIPIATRADAFAYAAVTAGLGGLPGDKYGMQLFYHTFRTKLRIMFMWAAETACEEKK